MKDPPDIGVVNTFGEANGVSFLRHPKAYVEVLPVDGYRSILLRLVVWRPPRPATCQKGPGRPSPEMMSERTQPPPSLASRASE